MKRVAVFVTVLVALLLVWGSVVSAEVRPPIGGPGGDPGNPNPCHSPVLAWGFECVDIHINGEFLSYDKWPDALPYLDPVTNRTMVPVRYLSEYLKAKVEWYGDEQKVVVKIPGRTIELWIGKRVAKVNGEEKNLDAPPVLRSWVTLEDPPRTMWRTWVPLRFVTECLGGAVDWTPVGEPSKSKVRPGVRCDYVEVLITYPAPK